MIAILIDDETLIYPVAIYIDEYSIGAVAEVATGEKFYLISYKRTPKQIIEDIFIAIANGEKTYQIN